MLLVKSLLGLCQIVSEVLPDSSCYLPMDGHASLQGIHGIKREETPPYHYLLGLDGNALGFEERLSIRKPFCTLFCAFYPSILLFVLASFHPNAGYCSS